MSDAMAEAALFDVEQPPPVSLADKFLFPPMSILDRRSGDWQDRKRQWGRVGMQSELGRGQVLMREGTDAVSMMHTGYQGGTSIFDPVVCELVYRWFSAPGARVLDPFAGGSVRGITASILGRDYLGIELRREQVEANRAQVCLGSDIEPQWMWGDSADLDRVLLGPDYEADLVFSCPPYADLEVYSDDPRDISAMAYPEFLTTYRWIIQQAVTRLRNDRFAAWVVSDVRGPDGSYRGLVADTIRAFTDAGMGLHNDAVMVDQIGTAALRAERPFITTRKLTRTHQHLLVFVKGNAKRATQWATNS